MRLERALLSALGITLALAGCAGTNVAPTGYINAADFRTCLLTLGKGEVGSINASAVAALNDGKKRLGVAALHNTPDSPLSPAQRLKRLSLVIFLPTVP